MADFFLAPGFLAGMAAAAAPIIIHLLARRRYRRVPWAAMEFLRRAMKKTQRRLRLENLILLLLRVAAILLLALALARPVLSPLPLLSAVGEDERTVLLAIDNSASMGARGDGAKPFERARAMALEILQSLRARDEIYLVWVNSTPDPVFDGPTPEKGRAREEIEGATPSDAGTRWAPALAHLAEVLARPEVKARPLRLVYCISDLQQNGWTGGGPDSPAGGIREGLTQVARLAHQVVVLDVGTTDRENLGVIDVALGDRVVSRDRPTRVRAEIKNFGDRDAVDVPVALPQHGQRHKSKTISLGPGETAAVDFFATFSKAGPQRVSVELNSDALDADNRRDLAVHVRADVRVLVVDGNPEETDRYEHEAELIGFQLMPGGPGGGGSDESVIRAVMRDHRQLPGVRLDDYDCVILADDGEVVVQPGPKAALETYVREGGALFVIPGDRVAPAVADYARVLFDPPPGDPAPDAPPYEPLLPVRLGAVQRVDQPDDNGANLLLMEPESWQHPIFRKFDDQDFRALLAEHPKVKRYFAVDGPVATGAHVLARFSDLERTPALVERKLGAGRVMVLTTGWTRSWAQFHAQPGGLILLNEIVLYLARDPAEGRTVALGSPLRWQIEAKDFADNVQVILPNGGHKPLDPPRADGDRFLVQMGETQNTGFHRVELLREDGEVRTALFAVVGDPAEGDLRSVAPADLVNGLPHPEAERVRVERAFRTAESVQSSAAAREVAWLALWLLLAVLAAESLLARKMGRRGT